VRPFCLVERRKEIGKGVKELEDRTKRDRKRERGKRDGKNCGGVALKFSLLADEKCAVAT